MSKVKKIWKHLKNKDETIRLTKWMVNVTKPYFRFIIYIFLISIVSMGISYAATIIGKYVVDDATTGDINFRNMAFMCGTTVVSILISIFSSIISSYINEKFSFSIRQQLFNDIQRSVWNKISKYHSGDLVTRLTSDTNSLADSLINILPSTVLTICQLCISFGILLYYDWQIAVFALLLGPIGAALMMFFRKKYKEYQTKFRESESEYRTFMQESLSDLTVVKTFRQENSNEETMEALKKKRLDLVIKNARLSSIMSAVMRLVFSIGYVVAFCWGSYRISRGDITYGTLTVFITLVGRVQGSVSGIAGIFPEIYRMLVSAKRISEVTEIEKEVYEGIAEIPKSVGVELSDVSFAYDEKYIVRNVNLSVNGGEIVAVVGPSGAGKTTIIRMLLAMTTPQKGRIHYILDGKETEKASPDSRRFISYVPQGNTLKTGTIAENLLVGKTDATEEEMRRALKMAAADSFVDKLPDGLESAVSEKSVGLSEGQAQRIAIARALIGEKPLLILDEATSALDEESESRVLKNITDNLDGITCFIITHRRSMLRYCDRVIELDEDGNITEKPQMKIE